MSALNLTRDIIQLKWNHGSSTCTMVIIKSGLSTKRSRIEHYFIIKTRFLFRFVHKYFGKIILYIAIKDNIEPSRYKICQMTIFLNALPHIL